MSSTKEKILIFLFILFWNIFGIQVSKNHIAPNVVIWTTGFMTCGFITEWYLFKQ